MSHDRILTEILTRAKTPPASPGVYELEIRFRKIDRETFEQVHAAVAASPDFGQATIEKSVNVTSENIYEDARDTSTRYILAMTYNNTTMVDKVYRSKMRAGRQATVHDYLTYAVNLSVETPIAAFNTKNDATLRFKVRSSHVLLADGATWRFDFTAVRYGRVADFPEEKLRRTRHALFAPGQFPADLDHENISDYEIEIEYIGDSIATLTADAVTNVAKRVLSIVNPQYLVASALSDEVSAVARLLRADTGRLTGSNQLKQVLNQVSALSKSVYYADVWPKIGKMLATIKTDGDRVAISILGNRCRILRANTMDDVPLIGVDDDSDPTPGHTVIDAEMLDGKYYVFELISLDGERSAPTLTDRITQFPLAIERAKRFLGENIVAKTYEALGGDRAKVEEAIRAVWSDETLPRDGIIISDAGKSYSETRHYKWKPYENNTIDFLAVKCPSSLLGQRPYDVVKGKTLYLLFVGVSQPMREKLGLGFIAHYKSMFPGTSGTYYPIQFSTSANPLGYLFYDSADNLDRQIVELARNPANTEWVLVGTRPDRLVDKNYFGNDFRVAELTYINYIDPFELRDLWQPNTSYFTKSASDAYMASNKYKRFVVSMLMKDNISGAKWVIDLGAGRGGDLHRYQEIGVENALFVDNKPTAIAELIRRKFSMFDNKKRHVRGWMGAGEDGMSNNLAVKTDYDRILGVEFDKLILKDTKSLTIHTLVADLKTPSPDLVASTLRFGATPELVDGIVCNFALHYMCDTLDNIRNLLMFVSRMLKIGGVFIFLVMDGRKVHDLLAPMKLGEQFEARDAPEAPLKYAIKRKYEAAKLLPAGQTISVLLPFSDEMYDEPLCNVETVLSSASKLGMEVEINSDMLAMLNKFKHIDAALAAKLTSADRHYIGLHKYVTLRKVRSAK